MVLTIMQKGLTNDIGLEPTPDPTDGVYQAAGLRWMKNFNGAKNRINSVRKVTRNWVKE